MKDQYGKPDTCNECIHYDLSIQQCKITGQSPYGYEICPVPSKIQALKRDPWHELAEKIFNRHAVGPLSEGSGKEQQILEIAEAIKETWPKDKPKPQKLDVLRITNYINQILKDNQGPHLALIHTTGMKEALKIGGYDATTN